MFENISPLFSRLSLQFPGSILHPVHVLNILGIKPSSSGNTLPFVGIMFHLFCFTLYNLQILVSVMLLNPGSAHPFFTFLDLLYKTLHCKWVAKVYLRLLIGRDFDVWRKCWNCRRVCLILPVLGKSYTTAPISPLQELFFNLKILLGQGKWCRWVRTTYGA